MVTATNTSKKKRSSGKGIVQRFHGDTTSSSHERTASQGDVCSGQTPSSQASSFASSSSRRRRDRAESSASVRFEELPSNDAGNIGSSQRSSQRIRERSQSVTPGKYAEEEDSESNAVIESDSDGVVEVDKDEFISRANDTSVLFTFGESDRKAKKAKDFDYDFELLLQQYEAVKAGNETISQFLDLAEDCVLGRPDCSDDGLWEMIRAITVQRQNGDCLDEDCCSALEGILQAERDDRAKIGKEQEDLHMQEAEHKKMVVGEDKGGSEANTQKPVKYCRETRLGEGSSQDHQGPAKRQRTESFSNSQRSGEIDNSQGRKREKMKEEQVNGGRVEEGGAFGSEKEADNENRLGTMMQTNTMGFSHEAKQQEVRTRASLLGDEQPNYQVSERLMLDDAHISGRLQEQERMLQGTLSGQQDQSENALSLQNRVQRQNRVRSTGYCYSRRPTRIDDSDGQVEEDTFQPCIEELLERSSTSFSRLGHGDSMQDPIDVDDDG